MLSLIYWGKCGAVFKEKCNGHTYVHNEKECVSLLWWPLTVPVVTGTHTAQAFSSLRSQLYYHCWWLRVDENCEMSCLTCFQTHLQPRRNWGFDMVRRMCAFISHTAVMWKLTLHPQPTKSGIQCSYLDIQCGEILCISKIYIFLCLYKSVMFQLAKVSSLNIYHMLCWTKTFLLLLITDFVTTQEIFSISKSSLCIKCYMNFHVY